METLVKAKTRANEILIVQVLLVFFTYNCQNIFIVQATDDRASAKVHSRGSIPIKVTEMLKSSIKKDEIRNFKSWFQNLWKEWN